MIKTIREWKEAIKQVEEQAMERADEPYETFDATDSDTYKAFVMSMKQRQRDEERK